MACPKHGYQSECYDCWLVEQATARRDIKRRIRAAHPELADVILKLSLEELRTLENKLINN